jgi:hypothetical protein
MRVGIYVVISVTTNGRLDRGRIVEGLGWWAYGTEGWNSGSINEMSIIPHTMNCPTQALISKRRGFVRI